MSRRNGKGPKLELKVNVSPARNNPHVATASRSVTVSPPSSCVSSEHYQEDGYSSSPETSTNSMVLVGCPRCLMYVMLSKEDPRCPKCKSTVLLHVLQDHNPTSTTTKNVRN